MLRAPNVFCNFNDGIRKEHGADVNKCIVLMYKRAEKDRGQRVHKQHDNA